jgi:hypothetical protein
MEKEIITMCYAGFLMGDKVYLRPMNVEDVDWYYQNLHEPEMRR